MSFFDFLEEVLEIDEFIRDVSKSMSAGVSGDWKAKPPRASSSSIFYRRDAQSVYSYRNVGRELVQTDEASPTSRELKCSSSKKLGFLDKPYPRVAISPAVVRFDVKTLFQWKISNKYKIDSLNVSVDYIKVTDPNSADFFGDFIVRYDYDGKHYSVVDTIATFNITLSSEVYSGTREFTISRSSHMKNNSDRVNCTWYISICGQREGRIAFRHFYNFGVSL